MYEDAQTVQGQPPHSSSQKRVSANELLKRKTASWSDSMAVVIEQDSIVGSVRLQTTTVYNARWQMLNGKNALTSDVQL